MSINDTVAYGNLATDINNEELQAIGTIVLGKVSKTLVANAQLIKKHRKNIFCSKRQVLLSINRYGISGRRKKAT